MVEVTEIRRGVAWWVNGKEALKAAGRKGAVLSDPSCLPVSTEKPWNPGRWEKDRSTLLKIVLEFLWGFGEWPPPHRHHHSIMHPPFIVPPPPRDFIHCRCCIQHLIKSARKNTHNGGQQLSDALWGVQFAWGVLSHTVKAGRIVMWRPWKKNKKTAAVSE